MTIPSKYQEPLQYEKLDNYDPDIALEFMIEQTIREELQKHGSRKITVIGEDWKGENTWCIPCARNKEVERLMQWMYEIDVQKINKVKIESPDPRYMS